MSVAGPLQRAWRHSRVDGGALRQRALRARVRAPIGISRMLADLAVCLSRMRARAGRYYARLRFVGDDAADAMDRPPAEGGYSAIPDPTGAAPRGRGGAGAHGV